MKTIRFYSLTAILGSFALCGCGALSDSANNQADQSQATQTPAPQTASDANPALEKLPTVTNVNGKSVTLQIMPSGVRYYDMKVGSGEQVKDGESINMEYTGTLMNGTKFDSTADHGGTPFNFTLGAGKVIQGWDLGVLGMRVGGQRRLVIPGNLGYGPIPPHGTPITRNATLLFDVTLVSITK